MNRMVQFVRSNAEYLVCLVLFYVFMAAPGITVHYRILSGPIDRVGPISALERTAFASYRQFDRPVSENEVGKCALFDIQWAQELDQWLYSWLWLVGGAMVNLVGITLSLQFAWKRAGKGLSWKSFTGLLPVLVPFVLYPILMRGTAYVVERCRPEPVVLITGIQPVWWSLAAWLGALVLTIRMLRRGFSAGRTARMK